MLFMVTANNNHIRGEIFNVGSNNGNYKIKDLAEIIQTIIPIKTQIINDDNTLDNRSYRASFKKIASLGFKTHNNVAESVKEIWNYLSKGESSVNYDKTITLKWYKNLIFWNDLVQEVALNQKIL